MYRIHEIALGLVLLFVATACERRAEPVAKAIPPSGISGLCSATVIPGVPGKDADPPSPVAGVAVSVRRKGQANELMRVRTGPDGRFHFPLPAGQYEIECNDAAGNPHRELVNVTEGHTVEVHFDLTLCAP